jgi:DNA-binding GntR family transcriptional regulator
MSLKEREAQQKEREEQQVETVFQPEADPGRLRVQAYNGIMQLIISGVLVPGKKTSEATVASQLGFSREPVRQALAVLASQGFVHQRPQVGFWVLPVDVGELAQVQRLSQGVEALALRTLAQEPNPIQPEAQEHLRAMEKSSDSADFQVFWSAEIALHRVLLRSANLHSATRVLEEWMLRALLFRVQLRADEHSTYEFERDMKNTLGRDQELLALLEKGDARAAVDMLGKSLRAELQYLSSSVGTPERYKPPIREMLGGRSVS